MLLFWRNTTSMTCVANKCNLLEIRHSYSHQNRSVCVMAEAFPLAFKHLLSILQWDASGVKYFGSSLICALCMVRPKVMTGLQRERSLAQRLKPQWYDDCLPCKQTEQEICECCQICKTPEWMACPNAAKNAKPWGKVSLTAVFAVFAGIPGCSTDQIVQRTRLDLVVFVEDLCHWPTRS